VEGLPTGGVVAHKCRRRIKKNKNRNAALGSSGREACGRGLCGGGEGQGMAYTPGRCGFRTGALLKRTAEDCGAFVQPVG